ncbi:hypothetical protein EXM65_13690 [Clostridium botulinum]|uniref:SWIM-type domain-containing protein n=1 Tax=Clostridium botulinum TaxID=1491 RepID=A0A6M0SQN1_CLOBO|nr:hypothetical protein [Clostridium botulinum]NFA43603.1 hypothetical protein [Clostridium botulinum]
MNIENFQEYINKTILSRGYDYYYDDNITEYYTEGENQYVFIIQGSDEYEVVVKIDKCGEILSSECDCPYDFGPICKHEVAAYFKLAEILDNVSNDEEYSKTISKQIPIEEVLKDLSKKELISIISNIAKNDKTLKNSIIVKYSKCGDTQQIDGIKNLIDSIVRKYTGREGFITYRDVSIFTNEMEDLLELVRREKNILLSLDIAVLFLYECIEAFQYADDSNGEIGDLVTETLDLIEEIIINSDESDINLREIMLNKLLLTVDNTVFDGWEDYRVDLLKICVEFSDVKEFRNKLKIKIEDLINKSSNKDYMKYINESMLEIIFQMLDKYSTNEEVENFIKKNIQFTYFREMLINRYMNEGKYYNAIDVALDGEEQDKVYIGLVLKWKEMRYIAYEELGIKKEQETLAKELLFYGEFKYYKKLKELTEEDEGIFYNNLKQEIKNNRNLNRGNIYLKLILEENDLDELMVFLKSNPSEIEVYADKLIHKFKDDVIEIYKNFIMLSASHSSNRKNYQEVCKIIKRYRKISGKNYKEEIVNDLVKMYKKRPAFVDELMKI